MVEPIHPFKRRELHGFEVTPRAAMTDNFGLVPNRWHPAGCRERRARAGPVTDARRQQGDILQVAEQVRGRVGVGCATTAGA